jgi:UDP-glucose:(heptosyl)LPS alpha-1,3-glucosyltransferase
MKVTFTFPACNRLGGIERVMLESANYFAACGDDVAVVAADWPADQSELSSSVRRIQLSGLPASNLGRIVRFQSAVRKVSPPSESLHLGYGIQTVPDGIPWAQSVHRSWLEYTRQSRRGVSKLRQGLNPFHYVVSYMERDLYANRRFRHVIGLTQHVKSDIQRFYGCLDSDISVVPNGYNPQEFNLETAKREGLAWRKRLNIRADAPVVSFVANEIDRKGLPVLLKALALKELSDVHLVAAGRFSIESATNLAKQNGVNDRCHFIGSQQQLAGVYGVSDLFVLPTQYEAWGLVIVEALACGVPVITTDIAGASVAVKDGFSGQLCEPKINQIDLGNLVNTWIRRDGVEHERISESVTDYSWDNVLRLYRQIIMDVSTK